MNLYCNQPAGGGIHQMLPPCLCVHPCLMVFVDWCVSSRGCSTWSDPPFQIGRGPLGTAASSLPTFPSPLSWSWDERSRRVKYCASPWLRGGLPPPHPHRWDGEDHPPSLTSTVFSLLIFVAASVIVVLQRSGCLPACTTVPLLHFSRLNHQLFTQPEPVRSGPLGSGPVVADLG